jgi:hypothetical protein
LQYWCYILFSDSFSIFQDGGRYVQPLVNWSLLTDGLYLRLPINMQWYETVSIYVRGNAYILIFFEMYTPSCAKWDTEDQCFSTDI